MRIVIAGGAGFVGSHLAARFLGQGHEVVIVDHFLTGRRANVRWLRSLKWTGQLSVELEDACRYRPTGGAIDAILHLASAASPVDYLRHPIETLDAGSVATRNLLRIARRHRARFLLASTSEVYGDPLVHPQPEGYWGNVNPVGPRSVYDEAKRFAEALTSAWGRTHGVPVRIARIFNTYGPRMRLDDGRIIPTFARQALKSEPLTVFGDGLQTRSYCYVDDLVRGLEALLWSDVEGPVNVGNPEEYTVLQTARLIIAATGSTSSIRHLPVPVDDPRKRRPDIGRASRLLGWAPRTPFHEGLGRTLEDLAPRVRNGDPDALVAWGAAPAETGAVNGNGGRLSPGRPSVPLKRLHRGGARIGGGAESRLS